jgi:hypothetical protein
VLTQSQWIKRTLRLLKNLNQGLGMYETTRIY